MLAVHATALGRDWATWSGACATSTPTARLIASDPRCRGMPSARAGVMRVAPAGPGLT